ncbi:Uu.00g035080.m01.CDS01 [Anthostomella pinea]|uniref:Uu.00g035080.m01.CDS01 n=1 Tax=Anthostomella pinea TaxID=933095 RepID=A0AAI8YDE3_9PEZI|nr:Uu.00g035080.m01.CDS01 [Anthostomella pinea]
MSTPDQPSSNPKSSPQDDENGSPGQEDGPVRLTEKEKKKNHIISEQKRREAIRAGFDRLCELVPGLEGQGRSEGHVLQETVKFMRQQLIERRELVDLAVAQGQHVRENLYEPLEILKRLEKDEHEEALWNDQNGYGAQENDQSGNAAQGKVPNGYGN